ncbi:MAG: ribonuclease HII [Bacteriovoracia bacterium]
MIELKLIENYPREIIAVDEVGRSPLSGPVVIGALRVVVNDYQSLITLLRSLRRNGVKDSKMLTHQDRHKLLGKLNIKEKPFREKGHFSWKNLEMTYVTWEMDHEVIDRENIFQASMRGMKEAAQFLQEGDKNLTTVLIDGHCKLRWEGEPDPWQEITIIKGDVKSSLVGLAAIIAKERRDAFMKEMHLCYPLYGFDTNAGYPTREHRRAIEVHGPCPIHRKSFNKVKEFILRPTEEVG